MDNQNITVESRETLRRRRAKTTKNGLYIFAVSAIVLAVIIVVNLLVGLIPSHASSFDTTTGKMYSVSSETKQYITNLDQDITIIWVCSKSMDIPLITNFLNEYAASSSKITLKTLDPVADSAKLNKYVGEMEVELNEESSFIVVESAHRYQILLFTDLYYAYNDLIYQATGVGKVPYTFVVSDQQYSQIFAYAESAGTATELFFYAEDTLTKAIEYVTLATIPENYTSSRPTVDGPSLSEPILKGMTLTHALIWAAIFVIIIPLATLIIGLVTWIKRKRR